MSKDVPVYTWHQAVDFFKVCWAKRGSPEKMARVSVRTEEQDFLKTFLLDLPKVPSHYCRSSSSKMYLEPFFKSISHLHTQYKQSCADHNIQPLSRQVFTNTFNDLNLSLFHPKKDQCDTSCAFKARNIEAAVWEEHCVKKDDARAEKVKDKQLANNTTLVACMDLQGLLLCPKLQASALYYKMKLGVHNFTIYNMASHEAKITFGMRVKLGSLPTSSPPALWITLKHTPLTMNSSFGVMVVAIKTEIWS